MAVSVADGGFAWHTAVEGMGMSPTLIAHFRLSLMVSLGLVPVACGGATQGNLEEDVGGSGGASSGAGATNKAGTHSNAGTTSAGMSTGGGPVQVVPCSSPVTDPATGLVTCAEGFVHRPTARACGALNAPAAPGS